MTVEQYLEEMKPGRVVAGGSEAHQVMHEMSQSALKITMEMNNKYHTHEEIVQLMSELTGKKVDESFGMFPPFYTDCGRNIHLGKNVFINAGCKFQDQGGIYIGDVAFYVGWPKGWAVFNLAKEVWENGEGALPYEDEAMRAHEKEMVFPIGAPNDGFAQYFTGKSFLAPISTSQVGIFNVTFEPGCRNNWHIHHATESGGQILVCVAGRGYYQEWDKDAVEMKPGDCINIPVGLKHWHGAAPDSWFSHLAIEVPGKDGSNEWLEAVDDEQYGKLD